MAEDINKIEELSAKLDRLLSMHNDVSAEIDNLRVEIIRLRVDQNQTSESNDDTAKVDPSPIPELGSVSEDSGSITEPALSATSDLEESYEAIDDIPDSIENDIPLGEQNTDYFKSRAQRTIGKSVPKIPKKNFDIEKLIGENLINKIGILVLLIGVGIGAKYSIENDLVSPLGRIILGYLVGIILLGLGMWLKKKYLNFSAVLVSGAMAIFYFITFFAFNFYQLIGQEVAFGLMVIFTIFTVLAALKYDKQIIAHLGLVGAVSVPFLLSNDTGNALFLFSYLTLINLGIAFISLRKNWKLLFYSAFALTWLVYFSWIVFGYEESQHFTLALCFLTLFFILFYVIFIAYKFLNLKKYNVADVIALLLNALIFFAIGYGLLQDHEIGGQVLGAFAVGNAFIHFIAATIINKRKLADRNLFYLVVGLVLVCLTIAIPIQLDGHWVTIMWSAEAVVLFLIGRSKQVAFYEYISYALLILAGISLLQDWEMGYPGYLQDSTNRQVAVLFNSLFLTSVISSLCLGAIYWVHNKSEWKTISKIDEHLLKLLDYLLPLALILAVYFAFRFELMNYFTKIYGETAVAFKGSEGDIPFSKIYDINVRHSSKIWLLNYTLGFAGLISIILYNKVNSVKANWAMIIVNILVIFSFMTQGLYELSEMREDFLNQRNAVYFTIDNTFIWLRYLSIAFLAFLISTTYYLLKKHNKSYRIYAIAEVIFYLIVLWVCTSELIHWLDYTGKGKTYGLVLSIFWGIFSVVIIAFGIWKKKKHLRILGIVIFAVTLIKLFFYDLSHLTTIAKTIVMISLGALLLLTSFLYNKYAIEDEENI